MTTRPYAFPACRRMAAILDVIASFGWPRAELETPEVAVIVTSWIGAKVTPRVLVECIVTLLAEHGGVLLDEPVSALRVCVVERQARAGAQDA